MLYPMPAGNISLRDIIPQLQEFRSKPCVSAMCGLDGALLIQYHFPSLRGKCSEIFEYMDVCKEAGSMHKAYFRHS